MVQTVDNKQTTFGELFEGAEEWQNLMAAWKTLSENQPLPDTPEVREMVLQMFVGMYGEAWKELAEQ